ncbi:cyclic nucleotide-binding domain-containing protein [Jannaschia sp. R86511]|uniref:cyclic nucleotide-binding domain-containing protein n=1 Tax=Jannaschia sp. R86511 TaxID=3093853 RepID=UPI0036D29AB1
MRLGGRRRPQVVAPGRDRPRGGGPGLLLLLLAWGLYKVADWALVVTLSVVALDLGGPAAVGVVGALRVVPGALLSGVVSGLADRWPRPRVLSAALLAWSVLTLLLAELTAVSGPLALWYAVLALGSVAGSLIRPCLQGLLPQLASSPAQLIRATSAYTTVSGAATVAGPAATGLLLATTGRGTVLLLVAAVFAVGAVVALLVRTEARPVRRSVRTRRGSQTLAGAAVLARPGARAVVGVLLLRTLLTGFVGTAVVVLALEVMGAGEGLLGGLYAALGAGGLLAALSVVGSRSPARATAWLVGGVVACGASSVLIGVFPQPLVAAGALAVFGLGAAANEVHGYSVVGRLLPDHLAGRGWGALQSAGAVAAACGSLLVAPLVAWVGFGWAMGMAGALGALLPLVAWSRLRRLQETLDAIHPFVPVLQEVTVLAPLSAITVDRLARGATELTVAPCDVVVRQGDPGDTFFVVIEGRFEVRQDGRTIATLGEGASFGEIALLEAVPRTASVVATWPGRLLALDADTFVAVVTGHRRSDAQARDAVDALRRSDERRAGGEPRPTP